MTRRFAVCMGFAFAFALLASSLATAEEDPADIAGWHGTTWGMTVDEAKAALAGDKPEILTADESRERKLNLGRNRDWPTRVRLANYEVGGHAFEVNLAFENARLRLVTLTPIETGPVLAGIFATLESQLVQKYGAPTTKSEGSPREAVWTLKKTVIELSFYRIGREGFLILAYQPRLVDSKL